MKQCPSLLLAALPLLSLAAPDASCTADVCPGHPKQGPQMLQRRSQRMAAEAALEGEDDRKRTIPVGTIFPDGGMTPVAVPRTLVSGYPVEVLHKFKVKDGITVNRTHAFFPFYTPMHADFVRHMTAIDSYEYGQANIKASVTPISVMSDRAIIGFAEKLHTLDHTGVWDTIDLDAALADQAARSPNVTALAKAASATRHAAVSTFALASTLLKELARAGFDGGVTEALRNNTLTEEGGPNRDMRRRLRVLMDDMRRRGRTTTRTLNSLMKCRGEECESRTLQEALLKLRSSTATNCIHLERIEGLVATAEGFTVPLRKKMVVYRGQTVFSPIKRFSLLSGTAVFYRKRDSIYLYQGMSTFMNIPHMDTPAKTTGEFFVGTVDGTTTWTGPDARLAPDPPHPAGVYFYQMFQQIPIDYEYLFSDPYELCPPEKFQNVSALMANFSVAMLMATSPTLDQVGEAAGHIVTALSCTVPFLGGDQYGTHGYGTTEALAFVHGVVESVPQTVMAFLGTNPAEGDHWNRLSRV